MSVPFTLRAAFCAATLCALSACGGGGDSVGAEPGDARAMATPAGDEVYVLTTSSEAKPDAYGLKLALPEADPVTVDDYNFGYATLNVFPKTQTEDSTEPPLMKVRFGHLKGNTQKFLLSVELKGSTTGTYACASADLKADSKVTPEAKAAATCDPSQVKFDGTTLTLTQAALYNANKKKLLLNINTPVSVVFP